MNTAAKCSVFLACVAVCTAAVVRDGCQCFQFIKAVRRELIADVKVVKPRPTCRNEEIIVILKDSTKRCLEPSQPFAKAVVQYKEAKEAMEREAARRSTLNATTTAAITRNATATTARTPRMPRIVV